jgi:putative phosphoribosyl transferase
MTRLFENRRDAGRRLAARLVDYAGKPGVLVLALPRGGVPIGYEIAHALGVPLDVFVVRKLGVPGHAELAMGAIASGGVCVLNEELIHNLRIGADAVARVRMREELELERRERAYRGARPPVDVHGSTVIVVDDGLATGSTMQAAVTALKAQHPAKIIVAVPVAAHEACVALAASADTCVCVATPPHFMGVGMWYEDFAQTEDEEVHELLDRAALHLPDDAHDVVVARRG